MIKVLYDGWTAVYQPNSPPAIHLLTLLEQRHPEVKAVVALPGAPPEWLPGDVEAHVLPTEDTPGARLAWEQRQLPRIAGSLGAQLLHLTAATPALFSSLPVVLSPAEFPAPKPKGIAARLRVALASGGLTRLDGLFWPAELEFSPPQEISSRCSACRQSRTRISAATRRPARLSWRPSTCPRRISCITARAMKRLCSACWQPGAGLAARLASITRYFFSGQTKRHASACRPWQGSTAARARFTPCRFCLPGRSSLWCRVARRFSIPPRSPRGAAQRGWPWPTVSRWWQLRPRKRLPWRVRRHTWRRRMIAGRWAPPCSRSLSKSRLPRRWARPDFCEQRAGIAGRSVRLCSPLTGQCYPKAKSPGTGCGW
jgi:hypothetical protein